MSNKGSKRKQTRKYFCPYREERLWRLGSTRHYLYYVNPVEIRRNTGISLKKAKLLSLQSTTYLDKSKWIELFYCSNHDLMWFKVSTDGDKYDYNLAKEKDWLQTNRTLDPRISNSSVSEFTLRMSRSPRSQ